MALASTMNDCFLGTMEETEAEADLQPSSKVHNTDLSSPTVNGCFDCNICLDYAQDPVVTLCGHLYCWRCIYKWLYLESAQQQCPVCKASLSQTMLVPLYGRGHSSTSQASDAKALKIPHRPSGLRMVSEPESPQNYNQRHHQHHHHMYPNYNYTRVIHPTARMIGGTAIAVLPWVFGGDNANVSLNNHPMSRYQLLGGNDNGPRMRRQERSLHLISVFLFCCFVLCFLLF
ncbi:E3 ubiquitin-protein ligase RMA1H1 [Acorus calamus]|uniref:E3 ubiquitin-protein ligase RMA n=1 Tax=Acorus calamus TaxID=4465 RepID=A0AAV9EKL8_ACOCL|nr:E3 ubiquitin-protein ligase RMA1H1 [Acorus calamus]